MQSSPVARSATFATTISSPLAVVASFTRFRDCRSRRGPLSLDARAVAPTGLLRGQPYPCADPRRG
ncbi:MAG: hypothetical protein JWQ86_3617 [Mycobacterium sp.]|nr:hypothetical protein [Mycobacterium sp.]